MKGTTIKQIGIRVTKQMADRLQRDADADNIHVSAHVRRLLTAAFKRDDEAAAAARRREAS